MSTYTLVIQANDDGQPGAVHRVKRLLKRMLRDHGLKCVGGSIDHREAGERADGSDTSATPEDSNAGECGVEQLAGIPPHPYARYTVPLGSFLGARRTCG